MEVKINEIRVGNIFIGYDYKLFSWGLKDFCLLDLHTEIDEIIKLPVDISEEILLKVGFEYCDDKSEWLMQLKISASILYCRSNSGKFYWQFNETYLAGMINYIHSLQNFTYTFGKELDVSKLI